jgi:hypothetical protein
MQQIHKCVCAVSLCPQAIEAAATLYDDYCRVITPENLLTEESEEVGGGAVQAAVVSSPYTL